MRERKKRKNEKKEQTKHVLKKEEEKEKKNNINNSSKSVWICESDTVRIGYIQNRNDKRIDIAKAISLNEMHERAMFVLYYSFY